MFNKNLHDLTNEELVLFIQQTKDDNSDNMNMLKQQYWDTLYEKTEKMIFNVYTHTVESRFKTPEYRDDVIMTLKTAWVKAVYKYDITKDKSGRYFTNFARFVMRQEYHRKYTNRITKNKNGLSVHEEHIQNVKINSCWGECPSESTIKSLHEIIQIDNSSLMEFEMIELRDFLKEKLNKLKKENPLSYELIVENFFNGKTQTELAGKYNLDQTNISKKIKEGKEYLKKIINEEEKMMLLLTKERKW